VDLPEGLELIPDAKLINPSAHKVAVQRAQDVAQLGSWPLRVGTPCPFVESQGFTRWREYRWAVQQYVDRSGAPKESKLQVMQEVTGTKQEFLATFKRKLLQWLPHMQHKRWDDMWQRKKPQRHKLTCTQCSISINILPSF
jgi:hypothetical protein